MAEPSTSRAAAFSRERCDVVIVGSGFAGSILARVLARQGKEVILVERGRHPRFALGESSTPLAAISLERLAAAYGLEDLSHLAAYGRWQRHLPELRCGLKRGFTFYHHLRGEPFHNSDANENRLLVAASPSERVADCHWLRADVDHFLVRKAVASGVDLWDQTRLHSFRETASGILVEGLGPRGRCAIEASFLVDASGPGGFLATHLPLSSSLEEAGASTSLLYGHFRQVEEFTDLAWADGKGLSEGPYADSRAAVHHTFEGGWLYLLPFDHGVVSAGLLRRSCHGVPLAPSIADWQEALDPWPSLRALFSRAQPDQPLGFVPRIQSRLQAAAGSRWLLLPHGYAFFDPLFSTGMAWSLVAVERVVDLFSLPGGEPSPAGLQRYSELLRKEADQISHLVEAAWGCFGNFEALRAVAALYFAAASYQELRQRLADPDPAKPWAWEGFLGATDPESRAFVQEGRRRVEALAQRSRRGDKKVDWMGLEAWAGGAIGKRNVIGLVDSARRHLYPVDLDLLLRRSSLLGLSRQQVEARLDRLRAL